MDDVPFDLRSLRVIVYDKNEPDWGEKLRYRIKTSINEVLDSPLEAVLPTFLKVKKSTTQPTVTKSEKELISMKQDLDLLKREFQRRAEIAPRYSGRNVALRAAKDYAIESLRAGVDPNEVYSTLQRHFNVSVNQAGAIMDDSLRRVQREEPRPSIAATAKATKEEEE